MKKDMEENRIKELNLIVLKKCRNMNNISNKK